MRHNKKYLFHGRHHSTPHQTPPQALLYNSPFHLTQHPHRLLPCTISSNIIAVIVIIINTTSILRIIFIITANYLMIHYSESFWVGSIVEFQHSTCILNTLSLCFVYRFYLLVSSSNSQVLAFTKPINSTWVVTEESIFANLLAIQ